MQDGMAECKQCGSRLASAESAHHVSRAYDRQLPQPALRRSLKVLLVVGDCFFIGLQVRSVSSFRLSSLLLLMDVASLQVSVNFCISWIFFLV
jgi:hypothetical protein